MASRGRAVTRLLAWSLLCFSMLALSPALDAEALTLGALETGDLLVADGSSVVRVRASDGAQDTLASGLGSLRGIAASSDGRIFVATADAVSEIDRVSGAATTVKSGFTSIQGLSTDSAGDLYVVDELNGLQSPDGSSASIVSFAPDMPGTTLIFDTSGISVAVSNPTDIALDATDQVFVTDDGGTPGLLRSTQTDLFQVSTGGLLFEAVALSDYTTGNMAVIDAQSPATIEILTSTGAQTLVLSGSPLIAPVGIDFDDGTLFVADAGDVDDLPAVLAIDSLGNGSLVSEGDLLSSSVVDLIVYPVPEPGTALLLGVGLAGLAARRGGRGGFAAKRLATISPRG